MRPVITFVRTLTPTASYASLRPEIYRAQIGSADGKEVRWKTEKAVARDVVGVCVVERIQELRNRVAGGPYRG